MPDNVNNFHSKASLALTHFKIVHEVSARTHKVSKLLFIHKKCNNEIENR